MKIERSKPFARGVADLMYVGDAEYGPCDAGRNLEDLFGIVLPLAVGAAATKGWTRLLLGAGAVYVAAYNEFWIPRLRGQ